jgi:hypothetical protein
MQYLRGKIEGKKQIKVKKNGRIKSLLVEAFWESPNSVIKNHILLKMGDHEISEIRQEMTCSNLHVFPAEENKPIFYFCIDINIMKYMHIGYHIHM